MPRLYLRFYFALLGSLVVFAVTCALLWHRVGGPAEHVGERIGALLENVLPPDDAPAPQQQAMLEKLAAGLNVDMTLLAADRSVIAAVGPAQQLSEDALDHTDWHPPWHEPPQWKVRLPDGRWLLAHVPAGGGHSAFVFLLPLTLLALVVGLGAYPIVRRLTKRLERLQSGVESLGAGDLSARVAVEGTDEIAQLAGSFNRAAGRIEELVASHRNLLANASHELRTPLARIRMAVELMAESADPKRKAGLNQDIAELDLLIDEILLASRLDAISELAVDEEVDLLALAAEECARYEHAQLDGSSLIVRGDPRLLRRLLRNLLENAQRHGVPPTLVGLTQSDSFIEIKVCDSGAIIPSDQRERLFEPFYRRAGSSSTGGSGLGLSLVRQIARRHGGDARCVTSDEGRNCFVATLPKLHRAATRA